MKYLVLAILVALLVSGCYKSAGSKEENLDAGGSVMDTNVSADADADSDSDTDTDTDTDADMDTDSDTDSDTEPAIEGATCASAIDFEIPGAITGSTTGSGDEYHSNKCWEDAVNAAPELVYRVKIAEGGDFYHFIITDADFDTVIYLREDCENPSSEIICNDDCLGTKEKDTISEIITELDQTRTYYLFVDGYKNESGEFELSGMYSEY